MGQTLFNRNTKEKGTVGRIYESDGVTMYEVSIPVDYRGVLIGSNVSDWTEDILDPDQGCGSARNLFFN